MDGVVCEDDGELERDREIERANERESVRK